MISKKQIIVFVGLLMVSGMQANNGFQRPSPEKIFKKLDSNKDGKIDKEEASKARRGNFAKNFDKIDADKDGFITLKELKSAIEKRKNK